MNLPSLKLLWLDGESKLIKLTLKNELVWKAGRPFDSIGKEADERIESIFYTTYEGKKLRLYKRIYKAYRYRHQITGAPIHDSYFTSEVILEIVDENGPTRLCGLFLS